jgi:hypothetical protein
LKRRGEALASRAHIEKTSVVPRRVIVNVPVQHYQSVIAIESAVTGVLLFQIRFFDSDADARGKSGSDPRVRVLMLIVLTATLFGSLESIR